MPAKVIPVGEPANDSERRAIGTLRDGLPNGYFVLHNFEIRANNQVYEIDLAVVAPHCVYVVDVKGTRGNIEVYGSKWYPEHHGPYPSPLAKLRQHAKVLKSLICETTPTKQELKRIYVHAVVLLTAETAKLNDPQQKDGADVIDLKNCLSYFQNQSMIPAHFANDIRSLHAPIFKALSAQAKPNSAPLRFRDWQIEQKLGGTDRYTDYRARSGSVGGKGVTARLRVYVADPNQETKERETEQKLISNAYRALVRMPGHPNILNVRDFFPTEHEDRFVLVTEDVAGRALTQHLHKRNLALTFDQKLGVMRGVLKALEHAHQYQVIHRNLTPDAILIGSDGQPRLTEFEYARAGSNRSSTIAVEVAEEFDTPYLAPECYREPQEASAVSDLYAAGAVFYELLTGQPPYESFDRMLDCSAVFPNKASELQADLPKGLDEWLQQLCSFKREDRYLSAGLAAAELERRLAPEEKKEEQHQTKELQKAEPAPAAVVMHLDYNDLPEGVELVNRYIVKERLGGGGFAVAYKVFDALADLMRVLKITLRDRISQFDRFLKEYRTLLKLQDATHPHVVRVVHGDHLADGTYFILFDYLEGQTIEECLSAKSLSLEDSVKIAEQTASGLAHLHQHSIWHHDIKPANLIWTEQGIKIIDFNVSATADDETGAGGGTRKYLPPDYDVEVEQGAQEKTDRDLYALGLTFYQCVTGSYPFNAPTPPLRQPARDPREFAQCSDLSPELTQLLLKMLAPSRADRFASAEKLLEAIRALKHLRRQPEPAPVTTEALLLSTETWLGDRPNYNPFVSHLLTLYSQSRRTNTGTRGLDRIGEVTYVPTLLDDELRPAVLNGEFRLVIISGNAGDGKTAFIQKLEKRAEKDGAQIERSANGSIFMLQGRRFYSNYDGSQDEGEKINDAVLNEFLGPFAGDEQTSWPEGETRLIAINEGRLVDFLSTHRKRFAKLLEIVNAGLRGGEAIAGVAVINLNLRAIIADRGNTANSIFDRLTHRLTKAEFWQACAGCNLKDRCYVHHNFKTLTDPVAGPKVIERLKTLYTITHLRGRLHITLRDLRSALAFMIAGTRDCDEIHQLYDSTESETPQKILSGYYFNSWIGGTEGSADRLIQLLREIDLGEVSDPETDRRFDYIAPESSDPNRFSFAERGGYDDELLGKSFDNLNELRGYVREEKFAEQMREHRHYVAMLRRRYFFERRDGWQEMLPYRSAESFIRSVVGEKELTAEGTRLLLAINRGEGITRPELLANALALRVREVKGGTIRSYRLFDGQQFSLVRLDEAGRTRFVEHLPQSLKLIYTMGEQRAELTVNLDIYEMLNRLNSGYRPSSEEKQGLYLRLAVFKNTLAAAPYQEVLLTETGHEFYRISREETGVLTMSKMEGGSV